MAVELFKVHLIFGEADSRIYQEINKYCVITGKNAELDDVCDWAQKGGGEDPDLFLINCAPYLNISGNKDSLKKNFVQKLSLIKSYRKRSRLVLLLPENKYQDSQLLFKLLKNQIYDFWFFDKFDEKDIRDFLFTKRTLSDAEEYLNSKEAEQQKGSLPKTEKTGIWGGIGSGFKRIYKPYYIKSNIIAFWSEDNTLLNQALAILTAFNLAENGFKVGLIETISCSPQLASSLSIEHPFFNTSNALLMYAQKDNSFIRNCLFNAKKILEDENSPEKYKYIEEYPQELYFLPDGKSDDRINYSEIESNWKDFISDLSKIIIFEQDFNFLIFICQGKNAINDLIIKELAYLKFFTINMLPGSIVNAINERKTGHGNTFIIGSKKIDYIVDQLIELEEETFLYLPAVLEDDFINYVYLKKYKKISRETQRFIRLITEKIGLKLNDDEEKRSVRDRFSQLGKMLKVGI